MRLLLVVTSLLCHGAVSLVYQQVAFDNSDVCWWSLLPPDLVCPVLRYEKLDHDSLDALTATYGWHGEYQCKDEDPYCLFFNSGFAGGRGIAAITTKDNIEKVKKIGDLLLSYEVSFDTAAKLPYHLDETSEKGQGLVADRPFSRGDPIMGHTPVLLVHPSFRKALPAYKQQALLENAVSSLPESTRTLFMSQMAHVDKEHRISAILDTNSFDVDLGGHDGYHYGGFPEVAKLNHDCRPNAAFYVDPRTLIHITTAVRPVSPGHELTLSYLDPMAPWAERQERAQHKWGHGCTCLQCSVAPDDVTKSDSRLREIKWLEAQLGDHGSEDVEAGSITYLTGHYKTERLESKLAKPYTLASLNMNLLGYEKRAVKYATAAIASLKIEQGADAPDVKVMEDLIRDPKRHHTYKGRLGKGK